jgi:hypothetical protein
MSAKAKGRAITILGKDIKPGSTHRINVDIARLPTRSKVEIPVIVDRAEKDGPHILIMAGIHGDELNGVEIVRQIVSNGWNEPDCGMVICIPLLNVFGYIHETRELPDGRDLNRVFPGTKKGTLASQFAYKLMTEVVPAVDYVIDYHTGAASRFNFSQLRISNNDTELLKLAEVFGAPFTILSDHREKSFREQATKLGKKVMLFEGGKSLDFNRSVTRSGLAGALRVMHHLKMRDFSKELQEFPEPSQHVVCSGSSWVRAHYAGLYRATAKAGVHVKRGDVLGTISDPYGFFEVKVKAHHAGYIICTNHSPIVNMGDALFHIAFPVGKG